MALWTCDWGHTAHVHNSVSHPLPCPFLVRVPGTTPPSRWRSALLRVDSWEIPSCTSSLLPWNLLLTSISQAPWESPVLSVGLWVLGGTVTSLVIEKFMRYITGGYAHTQGYTGSRGLEDRSILRSRSKAQRKKNKGSGIRGGGHHHCGHLWRGWGCWGKLS